MSDFHPVYPDIVGLDPYKRVRYTEGMVLGFDEFLQEELYLLEKHRLHNRSLHGYGTVCGLKVSAEPKNSDAEIKVSPGIAVDPQGHEVRVPEAQCASINTWLNDNRDELIDLLGSPVVAPFSISAFLSLCYRECETDYAPIPSGPCLSLDRTQAPTRIADDYALTLSLEPPQQVEEQELLALLDLLGNIEIIDAGGGLTRENIACLVRNLLNDESPLVCDPPIGAMHMRPGEAKNFIRYALRIWVTEVRPLLLESGRNCVNGPADESCVLLARIDMDVNDSPDGLLVENTTVSVEEDERPFLFQSRLLQAPLILGQTGIMPSGGGGDGIVASPAIIDETNLMHLTGNETVEGIKTFTDPVTLGADGRVQRRIILPPMAGAAVNAEVEQDVFHAHSPALRFGLNGEALFTLQVPDDIEYGVTPRVRVIWGVNSDLPSVAFSWQVHNRYAAPDSIFGPFSGAGATLNGTVTDARSGQVYVTSFDNLPESVSADDVYGALRIMLSDVNPVDQQVFLLEIEVAYVANRLGRALS